MKRRSEIDQRVYREYKEQMEPSSDIEKKEIKIEDLIFEYLMARGCIETARDFTTEKGLLLNDRGKELISAGVNSMEIKRLLMQGEIMQIFGTFPNDKLDKDLQWRLWCQLLIQRIKENTPEAALVIAQKELKPLMRDKRYKHEGEMVISLLAWKDPYLSPQSSLLSNEHLLQLADDLQQSLTIKKTQLEGISEMLIALFDFKKFNTKENTSRWKVIKSIFPKTLDK